MKNSLSNLLIVGCFAMITGCKTDTKEIKNTNKEIKKEKISDIIIPKGGDDDIDVSHIETISQENMKRYLDKYERKNNQSLVEIKTRFGNIKIQLFASVRLHRINFIRLAKLGYFDDTFFHRVDKGFVIQGGNSDKPSTQKLRNKIGKYLIPNEYTPFHKNKYGYVGMAKPTSQKVSNASTPFEFYIVVDKNGAHHLDKEFTVFGRVIDGMNVVEKISSVDTDESEWPLQNIQMDINVIDN